jgi:hypothetical protein
MLGMPSEDIRELTAGELDVVTGGTSLTVDDIGNPGHESPLRPAEFVIIRVGQKTSRGQQQ